MDYCWCRRLHAFFNRGVKCGRRLVQTSREKLDPSLQTQLDPQVKNLINQAEQVTIWTKMIISSTQTALNDYVTLGDGGVKQKSAHLNNSSRLASVMIGAGRVFTELSIDESYGKSLDQFGLVQHQVVESDIEFAIKANRLFLAPLRNFVQSDVESLSTARWILELRRLDLDSAKWKCASCQTKTKNVINPSPFPKVSEDRDKLPGVSNTLAKAQARYDEQLNIVINICHRIIGSCKQHASHLAKLREVYTKSRSLASNKIEQATEVEDPEIPFPIQDDEVEEQSSESPSKNSMGTQLKFSGASGQKRVEFHQKLAKLLSESHRKSLALELSESKLVQIHFESPYVEIGMAKRIFTLELDEQKALIIRKLVLLDSNWPEKLLNCLRLVIDNPDDTKLREFFIDLSTAVAADDKQFRNQLVDALEKKVQSPMYDDKFLASTINSEMAQVDNSVTAFKVAFDSPAVGAFLRAAKREYLSAVRLYGDLYNVGIVPVRNVSSFMWRLVGKCSSDSQYRVQTESFEALCTLLKSVRDKFHRNEEQRWLKDYEEAVTYVKEICVITHQPELSLLIRGP